MTNGGDLHFCDARRLSDLLATGTVSAAEVMQAFLSQIERVNPLVNALPTLRTRDELMREAREADARKASGGVCGPLHGLPLAIKDLSDARGIRTTRGSRIFQHYVPNDDDLFVARLKAAGGIVIGKTNTSEFGAGSQTFNAVFGATRNPYDLAMTCGGSSGGAAVAVACGMLPFADGADLGGSLRNPPSFCNVVGFRPSPGRVPRLAARAWDSLSVYGPIARNVPDLALLLSVMAGPDDRDPISLTRPGSDFLRPLERDFRGVRIAWTNDLGGYPVEPKVTEVVNTARPVLEELGCMVDDAEPDLSGADEAFQTLRAAAFAADYAELLEKHRELIKDTIIWNVEKGLALSATDIGRAEALRTQIHLRMTEFLGTYEFLVLPVSQVAPFPVEREWVREINGIEMGTYLDWMATCYVITCTGLPAISVPCGFTAEGLPIGLQIVGRRHRDFAVLELAHAFETATRHALRRPPVAD